MEFQPGDFTFVGADARTCPAPVSAAGCAKKRGRGFPCGAALVLTAILFLCLFAGAVAPGEPGFLHLDRLGAAPCARFPFGTDPMGRDIFAMVWHGGRVSLLIGLLAAAVSVCIAVIYGGVSGVAPAPADDAMTRLAEIFLSVPSILTVIFVQAAAGRSDPISLALVIGATSWMGMAKVVRGEVRRLRGSGFILAAKTMRGGFFYILRRHLLPNLFPSILFMAVSGVGAAIGTESTLSFLGIGLPVETVSWGGMLSAADRALFSGGWWAILIPGAFLAATLVCLADLGNYMRREGNRTCSKLS